ncbi:hypothetical protein SprV_0401407700 [Sparganum proliferum]
MVSGRFVCMLCGSPLRRVEAIEPLSGGRSGGSCSSSPSERVAGLSLYGLLKSSVVDFKTDEMACDKKIAAKMCEQALYVMSYLLFVLFLPVSVFICLKVVQEYERAVIFRLGRVMDGSMKGPGIFLCLPCVEEFFLVDLRTITFDVPPQEILTKDSVTVSVDAVIYYKVSDAMVSVANVENAHHSTRLLAQTTLRNVLGTKRLSEILSERDIISASMQNVLDDATEAWGIKVERVEIKDVRLPVQLQRAMAAEAEATREARAKVENLS